MEMLLLLEGAVEPKTTNINVMGHSNRVRSIITGALGMPGHHSISKRGMLLGFAAVHVYSCMR